MSELDDKYANVTLFGIGILFSLIVSDAHASTGGPLEQLGDMLGFGSDENVNSNNDGTMETARGILTLEQTPAGKPTSNFTLQSTPESSANSEQAGNGLAIPEITQREESAAQAPENAIPKEEFAMKAEFRPDELVWSYWDLTGFGLNVSPGSDICRLDNCDFEINEGKLRPDFTGGYILEGRLEVGVQEQGGIRTNLYNIRGELGTDQTFEQGENTTDFLNGKLKIGSGTLVGPAPIEYTISNGTLVHNENEATLILRGER
jgi:hypothetical protein